MNFDLLGERASQFQAPLAPAVMTRAMPPPPNPSAPPHYVTQPYVDNGSNDLAPPTIQPASNTTLRNILILGSLLAVGAFYFSHRSQ